MYNNTDNVEISNCTMVNNGGLDLRLNDGGITMNVTNTHMDTIGGIGTSAAVVFTNSSTSDATILDYGSCTDCLTNIVVADEFINVTSGSEDFHIKPGETFQDGGITISGFTNDIDGDTRTGTWDIGADELASSGHRIPTMMEFR